MDKLSQLVGRHTLSASVFYNGEFCGSNAFSKDGKTGQLHLVRSGTVVFMHEDQPEIRVSEPALVFYPRGKGHAVNVAGAPARLLCATIGYDQGVQNWLARVLPDIICMPLARAPEIEHTIQMLFAEASSAGMGREAILDRLFDVLAMQLIRHHCIADGHSLSLLTALGDRHLSPALAAIHERPHQPWQLASLAKVAGMSRSAFAEHFGKVVGITPAAYLAQWRMTLARRLLRAGLPVKVVSDRIGYRSSSVFSRAFTNEFGKAPTEWLKNPD